jgi:heme-degrading monooxygenase HmoA
MLTGVQDIDAAVTYLQETALPILESQRGYKGVSAGADRSAGLLGLLSLWETAADREASDSALAKAREDARNDLATGMTVELLDQVAGQVSKQPQVGDALALTRINIEPSRIAENVERFNQEILPQVSQMAGFRSARILINPSTGEGAVSSVWDNEQNRTAALEAAEAIRADAASRGVTFGDRILGEIVFSSLK